MGNCGCRENLPKEPGNYNIKTMTDNNDLTFKPQTPEISKEPSELSVQKIIDKIKENFIEHSQTEVEITEISQNEFEEIINSLPTIKKIISQYKNELDSITYEGQDKIVSLPPIKFVYGLIDESENTQYYSGDWNKKGLNSGIGTMIMKDKSIYKGSIDSGEFVKGILVNDDGEYYIGEWLSGKFNGKGILCENDNTRYEGNFKLGMKDGYGKETYEDNSYYIGEFINDRKEGKGKMCFNDGSYYEGMFKKSKYEGNGEFHWYDGRVYKGDFSNGMMEGKGSHFWPDGSSYEGEYSNGLKHGDGTYTWPNKNKYTGKWFQNLPHGNGILQKDDMNYDITFRFGKIISSLIDIKFPNNREEILKSIEEIKEENPLIQSTEKNIKTTYNGNNKENMHLSTIYRENIKKTEVDCKIKTPFNNDATDHNSNNDLDANK